MTAVEPLRSAPLLSVRGLVKHFPVKKGLLQRTVGPNVRANPAVSAFKPALAAA